MPKNQENIFGQKMQEQKERKYISGCSEAFSAADPSDDYVQQHADGQQPDCSGKEINIVGWVGGLVGLVGGRVVDQWVG